MKDRITLGLLIDQLVSGYARRIIDGVSRGSRSQDANLIVFSGRILGTPHAHDYQNNVIFDCITPRAVDALVMATGSQGTYLSFDRLLDYMGQFKGIPLVSLGIRIEGSPAVLTDNRSGILEAMDHLIDVHGLRRIAFLKGPEINREAQDRFAAYREALRSRGLGEDPGLWIPCDFTRAGARRALSGYCDARGKPGFDALLAANDEMALGALEELRERGCAVPREIAVIGFDNIQDAQFALPSLTSVGQLLEDQGASAASIAAKLARGRPAPPDVVLPARLVLRTSCGCLPQGVAALTALPTRRSPAAPAVDPGKVIERWLQRYPPSPPLLSLDTLRRHLAALVDKAGTGAFLTTFQEVLNDEVAADIDITPWQSLLAWLQRELVPAARTAKHLAILQGYFQQALALLSEMLRLEQGRALSALRGHTSQLRRVTERLASGASVNELMDDCADELGLLDIRTCFIACYPEEKRHRRDETWVVPDRAEAALAWVDGSRIPVAGTDRTFSPAERFIPARFLPAERRFTLVTTALFFREDQIGYIAFEPGQRDPAIYETFCVQLSSLLNGSLLFAARRRATETLERERALIAALMDNLPDHIYFKDEHSRFILINSSMARAMGVGDPSQAVGRTDFDLYTPEHAQPAFDAEQEIMRTGVPLVDFEERETWPDGRTTWVSTTKMPLRDRQGRIIGTFGISKDISDRRHAEERILRLAALVESSQEAIFGADAMDLVTSWNSGAEGMFGYRADEILGRPVSLLFTPEESDTTRLSWDKVRAGGEVPAFESTGRKKDGATIPVSCALAPIRGQNGEIVGTAVIARDLTKEKAIQARLIQAQRLESLGTLAGGIAHQFNNINAVIKGYLDALLDSPGVSDLLRSYAEEALKGVGRLVDITGRMQGLTASEAGGDTCRLNLLTRSLLQAFEQRFEDMKVGVNLLLQETPPVRMNASRAAFVITSLLDNALDAMLEQPTRTLQIRTGTSGALVFLEVQDSGAGIPRDDIPRLFTPFFTTKGEWAPSNSPQAKVKGVGLSLSVCRSTVAESGGRIEVESEPGAGTKFRVWLPTAG